MSGYRDDAGAVKAIYLSDLYDIIYSPEPIFKTIKCTQDREKILDQATGLRNECHQLSIATRQAGSIKASSEKVFWDYLLTKGSPLICINQTFTDGAIDYTNYYRELLKTNTTGSFIASVAVKNDDNQVVTSQNKTIHIREREVFDATKEVDNILKFLTETAVQISNKTINLKTEKQKSDLKDSKAKVQKDINILKANLENTCQKTPAKKICEKKTNLETIEKLIKTIIESPSTDISNSSLDMITKQYIDFVDVYKAHFNTNGEDGLGTTKTEL